MSEGRDEPTHHFVEGRPRLHAVEWRAGRSPTLFLLHGATQHARYWDPLVRLLRPYRVLALDARGHGASEWGEPGSYDEAHYLGDLERAIDELAPGERVGLIGHSTGSLVSMQYAAAHPERLWAAVFIDIDPKPPPHQREHLQAAGARPARQFASFAEARGRLERLTPGLSARDYEMLVETTFERIGDGAYRPRLDQRTLAEFPQFDNTSLLSRIEAPALVMRGAESTTNGAAAAAAAAAALPRGELATLRGEHQLQAQEPEAVAEALLAFLGRCAAGV